MPRKTKEVIRKTPENTLDPLEIFQPKDHGIDGYDVVFISASDVLKERQAKLEYFETDTPLDELLKVRESGFETSNVYAISGKPEVGKTQTAYTLAVLNPYDVVWIDGGEDTFKPERIIEIALARGLDPTPIINKIHFIKAFNASYLEAIVRKTPGIYMRLLKEDIEEMKKEIAEADKPKKKTRKKKKVVGREWIKSKLKTGRVGLVVLDSIAVGFRLEYQTLDALAPRQRALFRVIACLRLMSQWFNCVVLIINQIIAKPGMFSTSVPVGGPTFGHNIDFQIKMRKGRRGIHIAEIIGSSNAPLGEIEFVITEKGIEDLEAIKPKKDKKSD